MQHGSYMVGLKGKVSALGNKENNELRADRKRTWWLEVDREKIQSFEWTQYGMSAFELAQIS
jgi:hypothetical protein